LSETRSARSLICSAAALARWAKEPTGPHAALMHAGFLAKLCREVDPEGKLPEAERITRAKRLRKAHCLKMAAKSAIVRKQRSEERKG
jgi:hypothetical protein